MSLYVKYKKEQIKRGKNLLYSEQKVNSNHIRTILPRGSDCSAHFALFTCHSKTLCSLSTLGLVFYQKKMKNEDAKREDYLWTFWPRSGCSNTCKLSWLLRPWVANNSGQWKAELDNWLVFYFFSPGGSAHYHKGGVVGITLKASWGGLKLVGFFTGM